MSKNRHNVENTPADVPDTGDAVEVATAFEMIPVPADNFVLTFRRNHLNPDRASYGIQGNPGIVVFDRGLFVGATKPVDNNDLAGLPATIRLDSPMVSPKLDNAAAKAEAAVAKAAEKAAKAEAKVAAAAQKAKDKADKAAAALAAAKAKVDAATAKVAASTSADVPATV